MCSDEYGLAACEQYKGPSSPRPVTCAEHSCIGVCVRVRVCVHVCVCECAVMDMALQHIGLSSPEWLTICVECRRVLLWVSVVSCRAYEYKFFVLCSVCSVCVFVCVCVCVWC